MTLDPNAKGFSLVNALACAQASALAYDPPPGAIRFDSELAHVLVIEGDVRVIAPRGTACIRDFITDAKYRRRKIGDGCEIHEGFDDGVESIYGPVFDYLKSAPPKPLYFMGHSYGGALAVRLADLWDQRRAIRGEVDYIQGVYTVGQPRLYNRTAANKYDARLRDRTIRIVFEEDIVARIPLYPPPLICNLHAPYWHCGQEIFLPVNGGFVPSPSLLQLAISDVTGLYRAWRLRGIPGLVEDPFDDHAVAKNYVDRLEQLQPATTQEVTP